MESFRHAVSQKAHHPDGDERRRTGRCETIGFAFSAITTITTLVTLPAEMTITMGPPQDAVCCRFSTGGVIVRPGSARQATSASERSATASA
jgi:hypothetical protein